MKTAFNATKLAIAAFIVPYIFAMNPAMLLIDTTAIQVVLVVVSSIIGIFGVAAGLNGYLFRPLNLLFRGMLIIAGLLMMDPNPVTDVIGLALMAVVFALQYFGAKKSDTAG